MTCATALTTAGMRLGIAIKGLRGGRDWTQQDLADRAHITRERINRIERTVTDADELRDGESVLLAHAFDMTEREFLEWWGKQSGNGAASTHRTEPGRGIPIINKT